MKTINLFLCVTLIVHSAHSHNSILTHYALGTVGKMNKKLLILSAQHGPTALARMHTIALRTFLSSLAIDSQPIDFITQQATAITEQEPITYKMYLEQTKSGSLKYAEHDHRDRIDIEMIDIFSTLTQELAALFAQEHIEPNGWPGSQFFATSAAYHVLRDNLRAHAEHITINDYLAHLDELSNNLENTEQFPLIKQSVMDNLKAQFAQSKNKFLQFIQSKTTHQSNQLIINFAFDIIQTGETITDLKTMIDIFTTPSSIIAQAGFLSGILQSQKQNNHTIFLGHEHQADIIINYAREHGYEFNCIVPLIEKKDDKLYAIDIWTCINLFMHSFASQKIIMGQQNFLQVLQKRHVTRCPTHSLLVQTH